MTTAQPATGAAPLAPASPFERLESLLRELIVEHESLISLAGAHREALRKADLPSVGACIRAQNECVQRVAELEKRRLELVAEIASAHISKASAEAWRRETISRLASLAPEPLRRRLITLGATLKETLLRLQQEQRVLKAAAESLASHMSGLMEQVARQLSHAGTYGRRGSVESRVPVSSALDLTL